MKKTKILMMLTAVVLLSSCMSDDATDTYKDFINNWGNNDNGTITSASGELSTFEVAIDKETAEPTDVATANLSRGQRRHQYTTIYEDGYYRHVQSCRKD